MTRTDKAMLDDAGLDAFFTAARADAPMPSAGLMARIMADADRELAARRAPAPRAQTKARGGLARHWASFLGNVGGWPALAGMVTATVAGLWLGFASPDSLNTLAGGLLLPETDTAAGYDLEDMLPGYLSLDFDLEVQG